MSMETPVETFFQEEVGRAFRERGLLAGALTASYVANLLASYAAQPLDDTPLAFKMKEAIEASGHERRHCLRQIGDRSLFVSGFFGESLGRRLVDVDYYIEMGCTAYGTLAKTEKVFAAVGESFVGVFQELSERFETIVDALILVSQRTSLAQRSTDIVRLVERWQQTGSRFTARRLAAAGVVLPKDTRAQ